MLAESAADKAQSHVDFVRDARGRKSEKARPRDQDACAGFASYPPYSFEYPVYAP